MTAIKTTVAPSSMEEASDKTNNTNFTPSTTEEEAKNRFVDQLQNGVDKLLAKGNGRDRISTQLLNEIADGCSPDETEVCYYLYVLCLWWCFGMISVVFLSSPYSF